MNIEKHNEHMAKQIFGRAMALRMPETIIDACCETPEFADRCDLEVKDLLTRDRIIELMESDDFDAEKLMLLIATHRGDLLDMAEVVDRYVRGLAEDVAYTTIKHEMEA